jgi:HPt (histidine-containing phosphotransfer) domain-containing protein
MADHDIIDRGIFAGLRDSAGVDFVAELIETFLEDAPQRLVELQRYGAAGDARAFRRAAHTLKANAHTFGATALAAQARALELADLAELAGRLQPLLATLQAEYERSAAALRGLRDE